MDSTARGLKQPFSALSHLVGVILAIAGLIALLVAAKGDPRRIFAFTIYGLSLIVLYSTSTIYHAFHVSPEREKALQRTDHVAIFLLIAGTYTPVCLVTLRGGLGCELLAAIWTLAIAGILTICFWRSHPHWVRVALYVLMGWLAVITLLPLYRSLGAAGMAWMVAGGLAYTLGIFFYAMNDEVSRPWLGKLTPHDVWHMFVLTGSICHYILILLFVAPHN
jgi:hemolysin III